MAATAIVLVTTLGVGQAVTLEGLSQQEVDAFALAWSHAGSQVVDVPPEGWPVTRAVVGDPSSPTTAGQVRDAVTLVSAPDYRALADELSSVLTRRAIEYRRADLLMLHAGAVADPLTGHVIAYVGPSGRGKTTASIELAREFGYVTDETVGIRDDLTVEPHAKPLSVKLPPPEPHKDQVSPSVLGLQLRPSLPLRLVGIVMLDRQSGLGAGAPPVIRPIGVVEALAELVPQISYLAERSLPLQRLHSVIERVGGLQSVAYGEASTLVDLFQRLFEKARQDADGSARGPLLEAVARDTLRDGDALVVLNDRIVHVLNGIAPTIMEGALTPVTLHDLVQRVVAVHGTPPDGDARSLVGEAVQQLSDSGMLRTVEFGSAT